MMTSDLVKELVPMLEAIGLPLELVPMLEATG
jgi:hypothetical protein